CGRAVRVPKRNMNVAKYWHGSVYWLGTLKCKLALSGESISIEPSVEDKLIDSGSGRRVMAVIVTKQSIAKAYRRYARYYDLIFGLVFHPGRHTAIEHLHCKPGDRILEVGVGTGLSLSLYPEDIKVVGIDLSKEMLDRAKRKVEEEKLSH